MPETATTAIKVALAEDHAVVRTGLCMLLNEEPDMEVVGQTATIAGARRCVADDAPDVLVLDLSLADGFSLGAVRDLAAAVPVVVLTMQDTPAFAREAFHHGASAYVLKDAADEELKHAVRAAAGGRTYLSPALGARLAADAEAPEPEELSARETEVLRLIGLGHTNTEIGQTLHISTRTVESHRARILQKLRAHSRADLVRAALARRLV
jgi:two-component system, NarL family, response regulator NreC